MAWPHHSVISFPYVWNALKRYPPTGNPQTTGGMYWISRISSDQFGRPCPPVPMAMWRHQVTAATTPSFVAGTQPKFAGSSYRWKGNHSLMSLCPNRFDGCIVVYLGRLTVIERAQSLPNLQQKILSLTLHSDDNLRFIRFTLPSSLQTLTFGNDFNRSLEQVTLPSSLQTLTFGACFNQSLEQVTLPASVQSLTFGHALHQGFGTVNLLSSLQKFDSG